MLVTDLFQFVLKMTMIIVLAWVAVAKIGGMQALEMHLQVIRERMCSATGVTTSEPDRIPARLSSRPDERTRIWTSAGPDLHRLSGNAVVAGVVSGGGAGRRRICGATNVQR